MAKSVQFSNASFARSVCVAHSQQQQRRRQRSVHSVCASTSYNNNTATHSNSNSKNDQSSGSAVAAASTRRGLMLSSTLAAVSALMMRDDTASVQAYESYDKSIKPKENKTSSIGIEDMRSKNAGVQLIYEARDVDLPLKDRYLYSRDGEAGKALTPEETVARVGDAKARIDGEVRAAIQGQDWAKARNALRGRAGFLRFDLNYLVSLKDKASKKEAIELKKSALQKIEDLDYQLRLKNQEASNGKIEVALAELDKAIAFLK